MDSLSAWHNWNVRFDLDEEFTRKIVFSNSIDAHGRRACLDQVN